MTSPNDSADQPGEEWIAQWRQRHWPPENQIPGVLPLQEVLGRSDSVIVVLRDIHAFSNGLNINLLARGRPGQHPSFLSMPPQMAKRMNLPEPKSTPPMHLQVIFEGDTEAIALSTKELQQRFDEVAAKPVLREGIRQARRHGLCLLADANSHPSRHHQVCLARARPTWNRNPYRSGRTAASERGSNRTLALIGALKLLRFT